MAAYVNGQVTAGTTATLVATTQHASHIYVSNTGAVSAFLGGPGVTATGATQGATLVAGASVLLPSIEGASLYAITASTTTTISYVTTA